MAVAENLTVHEEMRASIAAAQEATKASSSAVQVAAVQAAIAACVPAPTPMQADRLWFILITGLVLVLVASTGGIIWALGLDKNTDVLVTIFTTTLAGLIGLFVKSPSQ